jgi:hypothetical protein
MSRVARRLTAVRIERRVNLLLTDYQIRFGAIESPPIPVEHILEKYLHLRLEFDDLRTRGLGDVHGATIRETRQVFIDERLEPAEHPQMEGRYNFTIAHEIGHWDLHKQVADVHSIGRNHNPAEVGSYAELEWQADKFASYLLMPSRMLRVISPARPGPI